MSELPGELQPGNLWRFISVEHRVLERKHQNIPILGWWPEIPQNEIVFEVTGDGTSGTAGLEPEIFPVSRSASISLYPAIYHKFYIKKQCHAFTRSNVKYCEPQKLFSRGGVGGGKNRVN